MSAEVGKRMVMLDGAGRPRAVLETVGLTPRRFDEVDAAFFDEGEGDQTLFLLAAGALRLLRPPRPVRGRRAALM
jgi:uncharacterized protein YhfF